MNCIEFEIAAECAVETRSSIALAALEHLLGCSECRRNWEVRQQLDAAIAAWRTVHPSAGLAEAVLAELAASVGSVGHDSWDAWDEWDPNDESDARRGNDLETSGIWDERVRSTSSAVPVSSSRVNGSISPQLMTASQTAPFARSTLRRNQIALIAVAACLVIAALFASQFGATDHDQLAKARPVRTIDVAKSGAPLDVSGTLTQVLSDLKSEYREMANETTAFAHDMASAIPRRVDVSGLTDSESIELLPDSSDMVRILQPIGSRMESALGFLWNAIPNELPSG